MSTPPLDNTKYAMNGLDFTGLDYKPWMTEWPASTHRHKVTPHEFPPLAKNTTLVGEYDFRDLGVPGDGFQLAKKGHYIYLAHGWSSGVSVIDVRDPSKPEGVSFIPTGSPHVWSIKCGVLGDILIIANEWKFFEPLTYHVPPNQPVLQDRAPKTPIETGIKIYDISKPAEPKLLSFYKTGEWSRQGGGCACHRFTYDGHYAYLSASAPGYDKNILRIVDLSDPRNPEEVSRFWRPGQWTEAGERAWVPPSGRFPPSVPVLCHLALPQGNRLYVTWFGGGGTILDITDVRKPTLISEFNYNMGGQAHTFMPIQDRQFAVFADEMRQTYMLDIGDEKYPKVINVFPRAPLEFLERGDFRYQPAPIGPTIHNVHENHLGPDSLRSDDTIYATCGPAGLRVYDVSNPYHIEESGYYVPGTPKAQYNPNGPLYWGVDTEDIWVDEKGLIYLSGMNDGLKIVEFNG
jgi:hypothetical protein